MITKIKLSFINNDVSDDKDNNNYYHYTLMTVTKRWWQWYNNIDNNNQSVDNYDSNGYSDYNIYIDDNNKTKYSDGNDNDENIT